MLKRQTSFQKRDTIFIVGAGPVGLWLACQIKLKNPEIKVIISEKSAIYVREDILAIKEQALLTPTIQNKEMEDIKKKIQGKISTKILEGELSYFAQKMGVMIVKGEGIQSIEDVFKLSKEESILALIGCDGQKSIVRQKLMKHYKNSDKLEAYESLWHPFTYVTSMRSRGKAYNLLWKNAELDEELNMVKEHVFLHQLMFKYTVEGKANPLSKIDYYNTLQLLPFSITEVIGKHNEEKNTTEVTCVLILDDQAAKSVRHFSTHKPGKFIDIENNSKIQECINIWMNAKRELVKQEIVSKSEKLVYIPISVYSACDFIDLSYSFPIAIAGEAAFGVPYFKSLNSGFESATKLSEQLQDFIIRKSDTKKTFQNYQKFMANKVYELYSKAIQKANKYQFGQSSIKMGNKVPWQVVKWSDGEFKKSLYKKFDPHHLQNKHFHAISDPRPYEYGIDESELPYFLRPSHR